MKTLAEKVAHEDRYAKAPGEGVFRGHPTLGERQKHLLLLPAQGLFVVERARVKRVAHAPVVHKGEKRVQQAHRVGDLARLVKHEGVHQVPLVPAVGQLGEKRVTVARARDLQRKTA